VPPDEDEALRTRWRASADAIRAAGGPALDPAVDPAEILIARISAAGVRTVAIADRRDEHSYAAALDRLLMPGADGGVPSAGEGQQLRA